MKNTLKMLWDSLPFNKPLMYLATNNELVRRMDTGQKFDYALNAGWRAHDLGHDVWHNPREGCSFGCFMHSINAFILSPSHPQARCINDDVIQFQKIAQGIIPYQYRKQRKYFLTPTNMELCYALWSLQRMLALAYPEHGFKLEGACEYRCDDSEALSRIASSIVSSVAIAYGHAYGLRKHNKVYRQMLGYGEYILKDTE